MPAAGLLALLDDIATMSKVAAQKTLGISGDDLAVNSQAILGADPKREWPIVWEVAKGSLRNKAILIPAALTLSLVAPWAIMPALTLGGLYLCFEGVEKVLHKPHGDNHAGSKVKESPEEAEKRKIRGAIQTDMILSAEIVVVSLGAVAAAPLLTQALVLGAIGIGMTAGIYGLVGGILKLDDLGVMLSKVKGENFAAKSVRGMGRALISSVPHIMKGISVIGTGAMFMVGGGLLLHGIPGAEGAVKGLAHMASQAPALVDLAEVAVATLTGAAAGLAALPVVKALEKPASAVADFCKKTFGRLFGKKAPAAEKPAPSAPAPLPSPETPAAAALSRLAPASQALARVAARPAETAALQKPLPPIQKPLPPAGPAA